MNEEKVEQIEKQKEKQMKHKVTYLKDGKLKFKYNIFCNGCKKTFKVRREVFDKRVEKVENKDVKVLLETYLCRECRDQKLYIFSFFS